MQNRPELPPHSVNKRQEGAWGFIPPPSTKLQPHRADCAVGLSCLPDWGIRVVSSDPVVVEARFWKYVEKSGACWNWSGSLRPYGYGAFHYPGGQLAHRYSYELHNGSIPEGMTVDHMCFNTSCVRPDHLRLLTRSDNARNQQSTLNTHCSEGHEYTPENTVPVQNRPGWSSRRCRICMNARQAAWGKAYRAANPNPREHKTHCPRGHLLEEPNIVDFARKKGRRACLACARTRASQQKRPDLDFQTVSDRKFASIMASA